MTVAYYHAHKQSVTFLECDGLPWLRLPRPLIHNAAVTKRRQAVALQGLLEVSASD